MKEHNNIIIIVCMYHICMFVMRLICLKDWGLDHENIRMKLNF